MGKFKKRKTGRRQRGKGTEQSIHFDALLFYFRLEQAESKTNVRRFELGRSTSLMQGDFTSVSYCRVGFDVKSGASAKDPSACESKSREQSDCTQEPPLATTQAIT